MTTPQTQKYHPLVEVDFRPPAGSLISPDGFRDFEVEGETFRALTWLHAEMMFARQHCHRNPDGDPSEQCAHCHAHIRYGVVIEDESGNRMTVGTDCAEKLIRGYSPDEWNAFKLLREVSQTKTKLGVKWTWRGKVDSLPGFWEFYRASRPDWLSVSKVEPKAGRSYSRVYYNNQPVWYLTVWGESGYEVIERVLELRQKLS